MRCARALRTAPQPAAGRCYPSAVASPPGRRWFLVVPFNKLFISKLDLIAAGLFDLTRSGAPFRRSRGQRRAVLLRACRPRPWSGGARRGRWAGRTRVGWALDPLMTVFYASPLVALSPRIAIFLGVGMAAKTLIIFSSRCFLRVQRLCGRARVDPLLITVVRSLGGREIDLYLEA